MFERLKEDIKVAFDRDPTAKNIWEVIFCYPGLHAILVSPSDPFFSGYIALSFWEDRSPTADWGKVSQESRIISNFLKERQ